MIILALRYAYRLLGQLGCILLSYSFLDVSLSGGSYIKNVHAIKNFEIPTYASSTSSSQTAFSTQASS